MPRAIVSPAVLLLWGTIALAGCGEPSESGPNPPPECDSCEWLIRGQSVKAAALRTDGTSLFFLKHETRELYRVSDAAEPELVAGPLPAVVDFAVGASTIWLLKPAAGGAPSTIQALDKESGAERGTSAFVGLWGFALGPGKVPVIAASEGGRHRVARLDESASEAASLWQGQETGTFSAFAADASGVAWRLSTTLASTLFLLTAEGSPPERADAQAAAFEGASLTVTGGAAFAMASEAGSGPVLHRFRGGALSALGALPAGTRWLASLASGLLASGRAPQQLTLVGVDGAFQRPLPLPILPTIAPAADTSWIYVGGETDLLRVRVSALVP